MQGAVPKRMIFLIWTAIGLFYVGRGIVAYVGRPDPIPWDRVVLFELIYWYVWAALTPMILRLASYFALNSTHWIRNLLAMTSFGILISPLQSLTEAGLSLFIGWSLLHLSSHEVSVRWAMIQRRLPIESLAGFTVFAVIVGAAHALETYRKATRLENALARAELRNLKAQLHPHFLFNTLHTISVLMNRDVPLANRVLIRLSELLRSALETHERATVPLWQELEFVERYLEIEQARFQGRLGVSMQIDPILLNAIVPNFLLQPLVENAVRHGIANLVGTGRLSVEAKRIGDKVNIEVRDNGLGAPETREYGIGLANLHARLQQLYESEYEFEIHNADGGGFVARILLPYQETSS